MFASSSRKSIKKTLVDTPGNPYEHYYSQVAAIMRALPNVTTVVTAVMKTISSLTLDVLRFLLSRKHLLNISILDVGHDGMSILGSLGPLECMQLSV